MTEPAGKTGLRARFTRRRVLQGSVLAGAGLASVPLLGRATKASSPPLTKYVTRLPIPPVAQPTSVEDGIPHYQIEMTQFPQTVHPKLKPTTLWGYDGAWPGPTFETRRAQPISVRWVNNLPNVPDTHLLERAYDTTIHGADLSEPHVRTVVHLHGAKVLRDSDGYPEAWFTPWWAQTGPYFTTKDYHYPNDQEATNLWYHDHSLGITVSTFLQVWRASTSSATISRTA